MSRIGFIGLGNMGSQMCLNLLDNDSDLIVFDLDDAAMERMAEKGADTAGSAVELAQTAEVIMLSLPGPDEVIAVVEEIGSELENGDVLIDLSTSTPGTTDTLSESLTERSVDVLSAPVSGGPSGAEDGTLSVMIGGDPDVFEGCRSIFETIGSDIFYIGTQPSDGHAMKLVNNYLSFVAMICTSEVIVLGEQVGLDKETMIDVINASSGRNTASSFKFPEYIIPESYDMGYSMELVEKDMQLLMDVSRDTETPFMAGGTIRQLIAYIRGELGPDADYTEIYRYFDRVMADASRK